MTDIRAFRAVIFNQEKIKNLTDVVCPPYDVISPESQQRYWDISPYNFIHILLRKDIPGEDKYEESSKCFKEWQKEKILIQEERPAIYFYSQQYNFKGERKTRLGFISLLRLDDKQGYVFGHEHTRLQPKEDRFSLIKQVKANLSPIFVVCQDKTRIIERAYQKYVLGKSPFIDILDSEGVGHKVWRLDDPEVIEEIRAKMKQENIFIADGHHRYEVACAYRDYIKQGLPAYTGEENFNYILTYFSSAYSAGLKILPIHRLVKLPVAPDMEKLKSSLKGYFDIEEIKEKPRFFFLMEKAGKAEHVIGMYKDSRYWLLRLKAVKVLDSMISDKPREYRTLDVSILNYLILKNIFGLSQADNGDIEFIHNADELIELTDKEQSCIAFFLNPVKMQQIIDVALKGEKMPPKSTYFYPKVLSGLVIHKFNEGIS